jgi:hypothetical protein
MSTATAKKNAAARPAHTPAQTETQTEPMILSPAVDVAAFLRQIAEDNAALAKKITDFRTAHQGDLDPDTKANLTGLARGHSRIANTLTKDNPDTTTPTA